MTIAGAPRVPGGPGADVVLGIAGGLVGAAAPDGRSLTPVQVSVVHAVTRAMTGFDVAFDEVEPLAADDLAQLLADRTDQFRSRITQLMVLAELVLHPLPAGVATRVEAYARALGVDEDMVRVGRRYAEGALGLAWVDLRRLGFLEHWSPDNSAPLHTRASSADPFEEDAADDVLAERWRAFEHYEPGSLGRAVWEFYRTRGFSFPGTPGSASPYLAQHDFVHVIADYGSCIPNEFEVFALCGRADPEPKGFAWLAMMIGLFESGFVHGQALFEMDLSKRWLAEPGMDERLADAMYRGAKCGCDLFAVDYHEVAERPLDEVREMLSIEAKSREAIEAGSVGPFDPGGISDFQREAGRRLAASG